MEIFVIPNPGDKKQYYHRDDNIVTIINLINAKGLSLAEAERAAKVAPGVILAALESNNMLAALDSFNLHNYLIQ